MSQLLSLCISTASSLFNPTQHLLCFTTYTAAFNVHHFFLELTSDFISSASLLHFILTYTIWYGQRYMCAQKLTEDSLVYCTELKKIIKEKKNNWNRTGYDQNKQ